MTLAYALSKTGHPNCRRPDKVIDARHAYLHASIDTYSLSSINLGVMYERNDKLSGLYDHSNR